MSRPGTFHVLGFELQIANMSMNDVADVISKS